MTTPSYDLIKIIPTVSVSLNQRSLLGGRAIRMKKGISSLGPRLVECIGNNLPKPIE